MSVTPLAKKPPRAAALGERSAGAGSWAGGASYSAPPGLGSGPLVGAAPALAMPVQMCAACEAEGERQLEEPVSDLSVVQRATAHAGEDSGGGEEAGGDDPLQEVDRETRTASEPVQRKCAACEAAEREAAQSDTSQTDEPVQLWDCSEYDEPTCVQTKCAACAEEEAVQEKGSGTRDAGLIHQEARRGLATANAPLPHADQIQDSFGRHDISGVRASVGGTAEGASHRMGALAFTSGNRVGFRQSPDLRLAAHEAAHTVQQREGLRLPDNVGRPGDPWERHADQVADAVVAGRSAQPLLDEVAPAATVPAGESPKAASAMPGSAAPGNAPVQPQITSRASRSLETPPAPEVEAATAPASGAEPAAAEPSAEASAESEGGEEDAMEAAAEGESDTPPEGVPAEGEGGGGAPAAATPATAEPAAGGEGGGGVSGACYTSATPAPPEGTQDPSSDDRGSEPEEKPQVTFDPWPAEADSCDAQDQVAQGEAQVTAAVTQGGGAGVPAAAEGGGAGAAATPEGGAATTGGESTGPEGAGAGGGGGAPEEASGSRDVKAMASTAGAAADMAEAEAGGMEGAIGSAEAARDASVAEYVASADGLAPVLNRAAALRSGVSFPSAAGSRGAEMRNAAMEQMRGFMERAQGQIAAAAAFAQGVVPTRLGGLAESVKASIQTSMEVEKAVVSDRIAQARAQARAGAAASRAHVLGGYAGSVATVEAVTSSSIAALDAQHAQSVLQVDEKETTGLADVNARFASGRTRHEAKGPEYADQAIAKGQEHASAYEHCKGDYSDDGFWDGCLTVRRARAQQDAACKTAAGEREVFLRTANKKGYDLIALRRQYRCAVISGAGQVQQTLDDTHDRLVSGLQSGRAAALSGLGMARDENLAAIDAALASTLRSLSAQEYTQRQAINDTGYLQQLAAEQLAHASAAGLARGIVAAMDSLEETLLGLRDRFSSGGVPDPAALAQSLAGAEAALAVGMDSLLGKMQEGVQLAEGGLVELSGNALDALLQITSQNDQSAGQAETGFAQQMDRLRTGASDAFGQLTSGHVEQALQAMTGGTTSMREAVAAFDGALGTIGGKVEEAITTSLGELDTQLSGTLGELDGKIVQEANRAAAQEQPAWKSVVAIVLIIIVIIAAAVISIVTLGAGASLFAVILVGALVGAVSAGLIQVINNWSTGQAWHTGLAQAMIMGAIGGAIGGGLGFAGGALATGAAAAGARAATQFAITAGADLVAEAATQTFGYVAFGQEFAWQGFVTAGAMSGVSFRAQPRGARPGAGGAPPPDVPAPTRAAGGAAGGRRAAVAQVAGGAAVGLGVEVGAAAVSGEKLDVTRAFSTAASGAVGARMARRGGAPDAAGAPGARRGGAEPEGGVPPRSAADEPGGAPPPRGTTEIDGLPPRPAETPTGQRLPGEGGGEPPTRTQAELDEAATRTRVGDTEHTVVPRRIGDRTELWICSAACGTIRGKIDDMLTEISQLPRPLPESAARLEQDLIELRQRVESTEQALEAGGASRNVVDETGAIARQFQELGGEHRSLGRGVDDPAALEVGGAPGRPTEAALPPGARSFGPGLETTVRLPMNEFSTIALKPNQEAVYVLRDSSGTVLKVGKTQGVSPAQGRFRTYQNAGSKLGMELTLEVIPIRVRTRSGPRPPRAQDVEISMRAAFESEGHIMPWDNTPIGRLGRLGRPGPGVPFERVVGPRAKNQEGKWREQPAEFEWTPEGNIRPIDPSRPPRQPRPSRPSAEEISAAMSQSRGDVRAAAEQLGTARGANVPESTLRRWLSEHGMSVNDFRD